MDHASRGGILVRKDASRTGAWMALLFVFYISYSFPPHRPCLDLFLFCLSIPGRPNFRNGWRMILTVRMHSSMYVYTPLHLSLLWRIYYWIRLNSFGRMSSIPSWYRFFTSPSMESILALLILLFIKYWNGMVQSPLVLLSVVHSFWCRCMDWVISCVVGVTNAAVMSHLKINSNGVSWDDELTSSTQQAGDAHKGIPTDWRIGQPDGRQERMWNGKYGRRTQKNGWK